MKKFEANKERDERKADEIRKLGYRVKVVWECELIGKNAKPIETITQEVRSWLTRVDAESD